MQQHTVHTPYMVGEVHYYSTELDCGLVLFDTGPPTAEGEASLLAEIDLKRLKYLFITHCHIDHYGLANYILQRSDAELFIPRRDAIKLQRHKERLKQIDELLDGYGFGDDFTLQLKESFEQNKVFADSPERLRIVEESDELPELGISYLPCPGHSQSDLVYLVGEYAVTGDTLLRNIFQAPLLDADFDSFEGRFRNYDTYCNSLLNLAQLRGRLIMPGHRQYIDGVDETILFYVKTLLERAVQVLPFRSLPLNKIIEYLFKGRLTEPFYLYLKISEIVFMLDFLDNPPLLRASLEQIGLFDRIRALYERCCPAKSPLPPLL
ncbi:MAG: MBL fold metallo-hydrolase [Desulfuromonadaceae bacterium]|nr:MBL fold metallo-hydrolase [Desulfuromonadaceae bacterium]